MKVTPVAFVVALLPLLAGQIPESKFVCRILHISLANLVSGLPARPKHLTC